VPVGIAVRGGDAGGDVLISQDPTGGAGAWTVDHVDPDVGGAPVALSSISCPTVSQCVAVDDLGNVFSSGDPSGGPTAWRASRVGAALFTSVSCGSPHLCVIVDGRGEAIASTDPTGASSWTARQIDGTNPVSAISCASFRSCPAARLASVWRHLCAAAALAICSSSGSP